MTRTGKMIKISLTKNHLMVTLSYELCDVSTCVVTLDVRQQVQKC